MLIYDNAMDDGADSILASTRLDSALHSMDGTVCRVLYWIRLEFNAIYFLLFICYLFLRAIAPPSLYAPAALFTLIENCGTRSFSIFNAAQNVHNTAYAQCGVNLNCKSYSILLHTSRLLIRTKISRCEVFFFLRKLQRIYMALNCAQISMLHFFAKPFMHWVKWY